MCSAVAQTNPPSRDTLVKDNGIKQYSEYQTGLKQLQTSGYKDPKWFDFWKASVSDPSTLDGPSYYLRIRGNVTDSNYTTFENVQRVMRIMPKAKFEAMFPRSTLAGSCSLPVTDLNGSDYSSGSAGGDAVSWHKAAVNSSSPRTSDKLFSYENFLKAVAVLPSYCGDYSDYPDPALKPILMQNADLIARKMLAATFAHALQETSDSGSPDPATGQPSMGSKIPGTFSAVFESGPPLCPNENGMFAYKTGYFSALTTTGTKNGDNPVLHSYGGRGVKQLTYPTNYSNMSLLLHQDLRFLAYPELLEEPGILGFLSAISYAIIPKDGNPSMAEVMDGTFHRKMEALANDPTVSSSTDFQTFQSTYDLEFPLTVLLVNGGPECDQNTSIKNSSLLTADQKQAQMAGNNNNTKMRVEAYNYFVQTQDLLNHVQVGGVQALPPSFSSSPDTTPVSPTKTEMVNGKTAVKGDSYLPPQSSPYANDYYNLTGNLDNCLNLRVGALNGSPGVDIAKIKADPNTKSLTSAQFTDAALAKRVDWASGAIYNGENIIVDGTKVYQANLSGGKIIASSVSDFVPASATPWKGLFVRQLYYTNQGGVGKVVTDSSQMPIYGGALVKALVDKGN